jgi:hypothetical protein
LVEVYVLSVTCFLPTEREKGVQLGKEEQERRLRWVRKVELYGRVWGEA